MSTYRVRFTVSGVHVRCRLFCAAQPNQTYSKCGDFTVRRGEEFRSLLDAFRGAEFLGEVEGVGIAAALGEVGENTLVTNRSE